MKPHQMAGAAMISLAVAIALGAFGAHSLKSILTAADLEIFKTGQVYHMVNSAALMAWCALPGVKKPSTFWWIVAGMVIFCGSLYLLPVTGLRWLGAVAPIGGTLLISGWAWSGIQLFGDRTN